LLQNFKSYLRERSLLSHFAQEASRITCSHVNVQKELCQLVISMAIEVPCLMYATLAWTAVHCVAFERNVDGVADPDSLVARFKARSIECLRRELQKPGGLEGGNADALLATVSTLCRPSNAPAIQQSVKCIIRCASAIAPAHGLSPAIVSTTPLFTAGCEARVEDRDLIRNLLVRLLEVLRIRNIKLAIDILESFWADGHNGE
jgi:hypothetical protein